MKPAEFRELPSPELQSRLEEVREELFNLRFQNATGQLENYKQLGLLKKDVARIETILAERDIGIEAEPVVATRRTTRKKAEAMSEESASPTAETKSKDAEDDD